MAPSGLRGCGTVSSGRGGALRAAQRGEATTATGLARPDWSLAPAGTEEGACQGKGKGQSRDGGRRGSSPRERGV